MTDDLFRFPLPGSKFDGKVVVASCYYIDDKDRPTEVLLMVLNEESPYFRVGHWQYQGGGVWEEVWSENRKNIVTATELYVQSGGDY